MPNKKVLLAAILIASSNVFADNIIGIGQVGDRFIYKISDTIVSLSVGDIVAGCIVKAGSGLQCDSSFTGLLNNEFAVETLQNKLNKIKTIEQLSADNLKNVESIDVLSEDNEQLKKKLINIKTSYIAKINKRNKLINELGSQLNSRK